ncbi:hypothetical protein PQR05_11920 [Paraburkholderia sediminicola]
MPWSKLRCQVPVLVLVTLKKAGALSQADLVRLSEVEQSSIGWLKR